MDKEMKDLKELTDEVKELPLEKSELDCLKSIVKKIREMEEEKLN